jgi:hypothetical protein
MCLIILDTYTYVNKRDQNKDLSQFDFLPVYLMCRVSPSYLCMQIQDQLEFVQENGHRSNFVTTQTLQRQQ